VKTLETTACVTPDHKLILQVQVPGDVSPGNHRVVVVLDEQPVAAPPAELSKLPLLEVNSWPADLSLRREDLYDDWGR
jgi:hypothetical protein